MAEDTLIIDPPSQIRRPLAEGDIPLLTLRVNNIQTRAAWNVVGDDAENFSVEGGTLMLRSGITVGATITAMVEVRDEFSILNTGYVDLAATAAITVIIVPLVAVAIVPSVTVVSPIPEFTATKWGYETEAFDFFPEGPSYKTQLFFVARKFNDDLFVNNPNTLDRPSHIYVVKNDKSYEINDGGTAASWYDEAAGYPVWHFKAPATVVGPINAFNDPNDPRIVLVNRCPDKDSNTKMFLGENAQLYISSVSNNNSLVNKNVYYNGQYYKVTRLSGSQVISYGGHHYVVVNMNPRPELDVLAVVDAKVIDGKYYCGSGVFNPTLDDCPKSSASFKSSIITGGRGLEVSGYTLPNVGTKVYILFKGKSHRTVVIRHNGIKKLKSESGGDFLFVHNFQSGSVYDATCASRYLGE
ncbi:MAG: hypothetical protein ACR2PV_05080 [Gammaproteobacteria bacterium]